ncbi:MAG: murein hydrolase activator EnvC family protein [Pseudomonadota bacterium]
MPPPPLPAAGPSARRPVSRGGDRPACARAGDPARASMPGATPARPGLAAVLVLGLGLGLAATLAGPAVAAAERAWESAAAGPRTAPPTRSVAQARTELARVRERIREITERVQADVARRDGAAAQLRDADRRLAEAQATLEQVRRARAESERKRAALDAERRRAGEALAAEREALAAQLRSAYFAGREEQLKVLLGADDPARLGRMLEYYERLGLARAGRLDAIREQAARLEALDQELAAETARLAELERRGAARLAEVEAAREARGQRLRELQARIATQNTELRELRANAASLEDLVTRLRAALEQLARDDDGFVAPGGPRQAFEQLRGRLPWPARGRLVARFGSARPGGLRWNGVLLETQPGAQVRAPYHGRVVYADWLSGLGLLLILDHGGGWLSLYAHNERLFRNVGDRVRPGDVRAASGGAGTGGRPELYFEIRRGTRPVDPRPWLRGEP